MKLKRTGKQAFLIAGILVPMMYLLMYAPIWKGRELAFDNGFGVALFVFQCVSILLAAARLIVCCTTRKEHPAATVTLDCIAVLSMALTGFYWFFFAQELLNIPWFPAQR